MCFEMKLSRQGSTVTLFEGLICQLGSGPGIENLLQV